MDNMNKYIYVGTPVNRCEKCNSVVYGCKSKNLKWFGCCVNCHQQYFLESDQEKINDSINTEMDIVFGAYL